MKKKVLIFVSAALFVIALCFNVIVSTPQNSNLESNATLNVQLVEQAMSLSECNNCGGSPGCSEVGGICVACDCSMWSGYDEDAPGGC